MDHLEEDERMGRDIQFQLLPATEWSHAGFEFSHLLLTSLYLSGDFLDYFAIDDHRVGVYVADVSGHGVSSGFVTVLLNSSMNHYLEEFRQGKNEDILQPTTILSRLNQGIVHSRVDKYLTLFYGVLDNSNNTLTYSNGGQFPCPLLFDGRRTVPLTAKGFPIGLFDGADYEVHRCPIPEEFALIAFSDGILEVMGDASIDDKRRRLRALVNDIEIELDDFTDALKLSDTRMLPDDITLLMIKRRRP
jgi:serine phosphatase RsbU (regulator of sigma subunit)